MRGAAVRSRMGPDILVVTDGLILFCNVKLRIQSVCRHDHKEAAILSIELPEEIEARLERLAERTGRSKSFYVREAILEKIEDMEDVYLAEEALDRIRKGDEKIISAEGMWRGLED